MYKFDICRLSSSLSSRVFVSFQKFPSFLYSHKVMSSLDTFTLSHSVPSVPSKDTTRGIQRDRRLVLLRVRNTCGEHDTNFDPGHHEEFEPLSQVSFQQTRVLGTNSFLGVVSPLNIFVSFWINVGEGFWSTPSASGGVRNWGLRVR
jgi:hypothetical protein